MKRGSGVSISVYLRHSSWTANCSCVTACERIAKILNAIAPQSAKIDRNRCALSWQRTTRVDIYTNGSRVALRPNQLILKNVKWRPSPLANITNNTSVLCVEHVDMNGCRNISIDGAHRRETNVPVERGNTVTCMDGVEASLSACFWQSAQLQHLRQLNGVRLFLAPDERL